MKNKSTSKKRVSAEAIAKSADAGQDVSPHFTNKGKMQPPIRPSKLKGKSDGKQGT